MCVRGVMAGGLAVEAGATIVEAALADLKTPGGGQAACKQTDPLMGSKAEGYAEKLNQDPGSVRDGSGRQEWPLIAGARGVLCEQRWGPVQGHLEAE